MSTSRKKKKLWCIENVLLYESFLKKSKLSGFISWQEGYDYSPAFRKKGLEIFRKFAEVTQISSSPRPYRRGVVNWCFKKCLISSIVSPPITVFPEDICHLWHLTAGKHICRWVDFWLLWKLNVVQSTNWSVQQSNTCWQGLVSWGACLKCYLTLSDVQAFTLHARTWLFRCMNQQP